MNETPKGYEPHNPNQPRLSLDNVTWLPMRDIPMGDPKYFEWVSAVAAERARLLPWTLVSLRGEVPLVAVKRTLWWRLVTWWLNIGRRRQRRLIRIASEAASRALAARMASGAPLDDGSSVKRA